MAISFDQPLRPAVQQMAAQLDDTLDFSDRVRVGYQVETVPVGTYNFTVEYDEPFELTDNVMVIPGYCNTWNGYVSLLGAQTAPTGFTMYVEAFGDAPVELHFAYMAIKVN